MPLYVEWLLAAACGGALALPFSAQSSVPAWCALAPVLYLVAAAPSRWRAAGVATVFSLVWVSTALFFITLQTWGGYAVASVYTAIYYVILLLVIRVLARRGAVAAIFGSAAAWVLIELLRSRIPVLEFPWLLLGHATVECPRLRQCADLCGVYGLSFLVAAVNAALAFAVAPLLWARLLAPPASARGLRLCASAVCALLLAALIYGGVRAAQLEARLEEGPAIAAIQGCVYHKVGRTDEEMWAQFATHLRLHEQAVKGARPGDEPVLICWAETMVPGSYNWGEFGAVMQAKVRILGVPAVFGSDFVEPADAALPLEQQRWYNEAFVMDGHGQIIGRYAKQRLVPFGEYVPWLGGLPFLRKFGSVTQDSYTPGARPSPCVPVAGFRVALNICIEDTHPDLAWQSARDGADVLLNLTNDGWFTGSYGPAAHLQAARLRAVEVRRPLFRITNTGVTAEVDPLGGIVVAPAPDTVGIGRFRLRRLRPAPAETWVVLLGDLGLALLFGAVLLGSWRWRGEGKVERQER